jgi:hypothetical protein
MTKRIQTTETAFNPIRDTGTPLPRVDPAQVQVALGAEPAAEGLAEVLAPVTLFAVRAELARRLQSSGGRPGLSGVSRRAKIPLSDQEWLGLEELAAAISSPGFAPTAGQVASVLLKLSLHSVTARAVNCAPGQRSSPLVRELAAIAAAESEEGREARRCQEPFADEETQKSS